MEDTEVILMEVMVILMFTLIIIIQVITDMAIAIGNFIMRSIEVLITMIMLMTAMIIMIQDITTTIRISINLLFYRGYNRKIVLNFYREIGTYCFWNPN